MLKYYISVAVLGILVLALVIGGIMVAGNPISQKDIQMDNIRIQAFNDIKYQIENYYKANRKLPSSLKEIKSLNTKDPGTKNDYDYKSQPPYGYQLCAVFSTDNSEIIDRAGYANYDSDSATYKKHNKGNDCLSFTLSDYVIKSNVPTVPVVSRPTATIMGPSRGNVGQLLTFSGTAHVESGSLSREEIWVASADQGSPSVWGCPKEKTQDPWCKLNEQVISGSNATFVATWTPSAEGSYYVAANAYNSTGGRCTGNPFGGNTCGLESYLQVTIGNSNTTPTPIPTIQPPM